MTPNSIVDLVALAVLLYCAFKGATRGLLSQLSWVIALLLCFKFSGQLAPAIEPMIGVAPPLKQWLAMLAVYVGLCGVSFVVAGMLSSWMAKAKIIDFDKHLGGILGFVKGVVICMTVMFFAITMSPAMRQIVSQTYSGYAAALILQNSRFLIPLLPENAVPTVQNVIDNFNRSLQGGNDDLMGAKPAVAESFESDSVKGGSAAGTEAGFDLSDLFTKNLPGGTSTGATEKNAPGKEPSLEDLLRQVPASLRQGLTDQAMNILRNSSAEDKQRLLNQLSDSVPHDARSILTDFFSASTSVNGQGSIGSSSIPQSGRIESSLLNEIAGFYPDEANIIQRSKVFLAGVPETVRQKVVEDWHSDAMGLYSDPDPATDFNTPIDDRILRQLYRAGISLDRLADRELRTRLSLAPPR